MTKTAEQTALSDLIEFLADQEPHFGWDLSRFEVTDEQVAIVLAAEPDAANDVISFDPIAIAAILRTPASSARTFMQADYTEAVLKTLRESAKSYLVYLLNIESERRDENARTEHDSECRRLGIHRETADSMHGVGGLFDRSHLA